MAKTLPLSEVKTRLPELVAGVQEREEEVVVTKNGRPAIANLSMRVLPPSFAQKTNPPTQLINQQRTAG